jgi:hypothetical protein
MSIGPETSDEFGHIDKVETLIRVTCIQKVGGAAVAQVTDWLDNKPSGTEPFTVEQPIWPQRPVSKYRPPAYFMD